MKDRLQKIMASEGLTAGKFADIVGVQPSAISHILSGRNKPGFEFISSILLNFPNIEPRWFILGEGEIYGKSNITPLSSAPTSEAARRDMGGLSDRENVTTGDINVQLDDGNRHKGARCAESFIDTGDVETKRIERIVFFYDDGSFSSYRDK